MKHGFFPKSSKIHASSPSRLAGGIGDSGRSTGSSPVLSQRPWSIAAITYNNCYLHDGGSVLRHCHNRTIHASPPDRQASHRRRPASWPSRSHRVRSSSSTVNRRLAARCSFSPLLSASRQAKWMRARLSEGAEIDQLPSVSYSRTLTPISTMRHPSLSTHVCTPITFSSARISLSARR